MVVRVWPPPTATSHVRTIMPTRTWTAPTWKPPCMWSPHCLGPPAATRSATTPQTATPSPRRPYTTTWSMGALGSTSSSTLETTTPSVLPSVSGCMYMSECPCVYDSVLFYFLTMCCWRHYQQAPRPGFGTWDTRSLASRGRCTHTTSRPPDIWLSGRTPSWPSSPSTERATRCPHTSRTWPWTCGPSTSAALSPVHNLAHMHTYMHTYILAEI